MDGCCGGHTYITHDKPTANERMNERIEQKQQSIQQKIIQPTKTSRPLRMNRHKTDIRTERQTYSQLIVVVVVVGHPTYRYLGIESTTITILNTTATTPTQMQQQFVVVFPSVLSSHADTPWPFSIGPLSLLPVARRRLIECCVWFCNFDYSLLF